MKKVILGLSCIMCTLLSALTTIHTGPSDSRRESGLYISLKYHEKGKFSFFEPIVHFYMKVDTFPNRLNLLEARYASTLHHVFYLYSVSYIYSSKNSFSWNLVVHYLYINLACLSVCLFVSNKRQNG